MLSQDPAKFGGKPVVLQHGGAAHRQLGIRQMHPASGQRPAATRTRPAFQFGLGWVLCVVTACGVMLAGMRAFGPVPFAVLVVGVTFLAMFVVAGLVLGIGCLVLLARLLVALEHLVTWIERTIARISELGIVLDVARRALSKLERGRLALEGWPLMRNVLRVTCGLIAASCVVCVIFFLLAVPPSEVPDSASKSVIPAEWSAVVMVWNAPVPWHFGTVRSNPIGFCSCLGLLFVGCGVLAYTVKRPAIWSPTTNGGPAREMAKPRGGRPTG